MKTIKSLAMIVALGVAFASCNNKKETSEQQQTTTTTDASKTSNEITGVMETASFEVEGMTCAVGCAATIEKKLAELDGVKSAKVDFETKKATVEFDNGKQSLESLQKTVESLANGAYKVSGMTSNKEMAMLFQEPAKKSCCASKEKKTCDSKEKSEKKSCCKESKKSKEKSGEKKSCCSSKKETAKTI